MDYSRQYCFAGITIRIDSEAPLDEYLGLAEFGMTPASAECNITLHFADKLPEPKSADTAGDGKLYQRLAITDPSGNPDKDYAVVESDGSIYKMTILSDYIGRFDAATALRAANFNHIMLEHDAIVLHSSYVLHKGKAILFCAPSGTGKSTQADLWAKHRGAEIVNGDRTLVRRLDGGFTANGIYYAGTSGICKDVTAPIAAIVMLGQAKENRVCRMSGAEVLLGLFRQSAYSKTVPADPGLAAALLSDAAEKLPVIKLDCLPDESAVKALEDFMEEGNLLG